MKKENRAKGIKGESIAAKFLKKKGYHILDRNYRTELGEIDLIITDDKSLIFVEVKNRSDVAFGRPAEAVTQHKRTKINQVAAQYIKRHILRGIPVRFDVIEVLGDQESGVTINHIENAFDSYLHY